MKSLLIKNANELISIDLKYKYIFFFLKKLVLRYHRNMLLIPKQEDRK